MVHSQNEHSQNEHSQNEHSQKTPHYAPQNAAPRYRIFWRSARALMHPVSIAAIILLIANDHWLRLWHPSWLTGKLGDFTWLVFAPFPCLMLLVWLLPERWLRHADKLAFGFIGVWFATAKTLPAAHWLTVTLSSALQNSPSTLRMDPTDLLTLPALLLGWWIWRHVDARRDTRHDTRPLPDAVPPAVRRRPFPLWLILGLALLGTTASDDSIYIDGITRICIIEDQIVAYTNGSGVPYVPYGVSDFSGMHWATFDFDDDDFAYDDTLYCSQRFIVEHPDLPDVAYQFEPGQYIEFTSDGFATRRIIYTLPEYDQDVRKRIATLMGSESRFVEDWDEPHGGIIEPVSGRVFFAMGIDGILMYDRANLQQQWTWLQVGQFELAAIESVTQLFEILMFETFLGLALILLVITHATAHIREVGILHRFWLMIGRWSWVGLIVFLLTPYQIEDDYAMGMASLVLAVFVAMPLTIGALWDFSFNYPRRLPVTFLCGLALAGLYFFPYVLWAFGVIPHHQSASLFALMLTAVGAFACEQYLYPRLPVLGQPRRREPQVPPAVFGINYPLDRDLWTDEDEEADTPTNVS